MPSAHSLFHSGLIYYEPRFKSSSLTRTRRVCHKNHARGVGSWILPVCIDYTFQHESVRQLGFVLGLSLSGLVMKKKSAVGLSLESELTKSVPYLPFVTSESCSDFGLGTQSKIAEGIGKGHPAARNHGQTPYIWSGVRHSGNLFRNASRAE